MTIWQQCVSASLRHGHVMAILVGRGQCCLRMGWAGLGLGMSGQCLPMPMLVMVWRLVVGVDGPWLELGTGWVRRYGHRECRGDLDEAHVEKVMLAAEDAKQHDRR